MSYYHDERKVYVFGFMIQADMKESDLFYQEKYKKKVHVSAFSSSNNGELSLKLKFRKKIGTKLEILREEQKMKYAVDSEQAEGRQTKQKEKTIQEVV